MKRLIIVRHAKSSWKDPGVADFDRPLNKRGKAEVAEMGKRLAEQGLLPDLIITSPARRARSTARKLARLIGYAVKKIREEETIYEADLATLVALVRGLDEDWDAVLLVGHNPGFTDLANYFRAGLSDNLPTCSVAVLDFNLSKWRRVDRGTGQLISFDHPSRPPRA